MARSMTGFARVQAETERYGLTLNVKSLNHRSLEIQMRLPPELEGFELAARQLVKQRVARGSVQVWAALELRGPAALHIRRDLVEGYVRVYRDLARAHGLAGEPDLSVLFRLPGVVTWGEAAASANGDLEKGLLEALDRALTELTRVREREAEGIVEEMQRRSLAIEAGLKRIEEVRQGLTAALTARLHQKLTELLGAASVDPQRVLQEAALLAERSDVSEEVQRLDAHNRQLRELIAAPGEVGKRVDFLMQEMNREANTIVSKTSGIGGAGLEITDLGLQIKAEIEKVREQGMNLE
jgi:uncharacterized protein (TIGR00255 family)